MIFWFPVGHCPRKATRKAIFFLFVICCLFFDVILFFFEVQAKCVVKNNDPIAFPERLLFFPFLNLHRQFFFLSGASSHF